MKLAYFTFNLQTRLFIGFIQKKHTRGEENIELPGVLEKWQEEFPRVN